MNYTHNLLLYHTITPLHVGCGQDVGVVDLPVIRERTTGLPFLPGSGIRGAVRDHFTHHHKDDVDLLFGPPVDKSDGSELHAGCVAVHDARLLLFPVRSDHRIFLWLTCPAVLRRLARDLEVLLAPGFEKCFVPEGTYGEETFLGPEELGAAVHLEEFRFTAPEADHEHAAADREALADWVGEIGQAIGLPDIASGVVLVSDQAFRHFTDSATVTVQRNALNDVKMVKDGALFSLEALPPESVLCGFVGATRARKPGLKDEEATPKAMLGKLRAGLGADASPAGEYLHLGGDEATGLGLTQVVWA
jgi:CRISPR-associated protein Cmr4